MDGRPLVEDISLALNPGELTIVIGPNGAGKSTLMKVLTGELEPSKGAVKFDGRTLSEIKPQELAGRRAVVPQSTTLTFPFTVIEVVLLGATVPGFARPSSQNLTRARSALANVELMDFENRLHTTLSGGEQQRVHLARAICQLESSVETGPRAKLLLLDEPTSNLDLKHQLHVLRELRRRTRAGWTTFAILHDLNLAALFADQLIVMSNGRIAKTGSVHDVFQQDVLTHVYQCDVATGVHPTSGRPYILPPSEL